MVLLGGPGGPGGEWPPELGASLAREGYVVERLPDVDRFLAVLGERRVKALLILARPLGANELLTLQRCRQASPRTAVVVVTATPTQPDLQRAFEDGATAFLSWPASPEALRRALDSGRTPEAGNEAGR